MVLFVGLNFKKLKENEKLIIFNFFNFEYIVYVGFDFYIGEFIVSMVWKLLKCVKLYGFVKCVNWYNFRLFFFCKLRVWFFLMVDIYIYRVVSIIRLDGKCYNVCLINVFNLVRRERWKFFC